MILFSRTRANNKFIFLQQTTEGEIQIQSHVVVPPPDTGSLCGTEPPDLSTNITLSQDTGKFSLMLWYLPQILVPYVLKNLQTSVQI